jgi:hypothetical protein
LFIGLVLCVSVFPKEHFQGIPVIGEFLDPPQPVVNVVPDLNALWIGLRVAILSGLPVLVPIVLARRGVLSMPRWLILAGACAFIAFLGLGVAESADITRGLPSFEQQREFGSLIMTPAAFGVLGCLLAAAFHKKAET